MPICFHNQDVEYLLRGKMRIRNVVNRICHDHGYRAKDLNYIFCNKKFIYLINKQYLSHAYCTDIITFPYSDGKLVSGDLFICLPVVFENAKRYGSSNYTELLRVIFHGALHLVGLHDGTAEEQAAMRAAEEKYLSLFLQEG